MKNLILSALALLSLSSCIIKNANGQSIFIDQVSQSFDNIKSIELEGSFCEVLIDGGTNPSIIFEGEIKASDKRDDIKIKTSTSGTNLKIWIEKPKNTWDNLSGKLSLKVPQETNIIVNNSSGNVSVSNISNSKVELIASSGNISAETIINNLKVQTSSGNIKAIAIDGSLDARSSSGNQNIQHIRGDVRTSLSSGELEITNVKGEVTSTTSSGSQTIIRVTNGVTCKASSGSLKVENSQGNINAHTSSGSIRLSGITGSLNLESSSGSQTGENITLTDNSSFRSSSGSIKMQLLNSADDLSFDLHASSGGLKAKGISGNDNLRIEKGQILVKGNSSSGSQRFE